MPRKKLIIGGLLVTGLLLCAVAILKNPVNVSFDRTIAESIGSNEQYLRHCVERLTKQPTSRTWNQVCALNNSADFIMSEMKKYTVSVSEQRYMARGGVYRNIIAAFGPGAGARIIVVAHYDVCGD